MSTAAKEREEVSQAGNESRWTRWRHGLGLKPNMVVLLALILLVGMGEELWVRFLPEYLVALGANAWIVAAYGTLRDFLDAIYQYPGGWLADRLGRRKALVAFTLIAAFGYALYLLGGSWEWILIGTFLVMAWDSLTLPSLFASVADNLPPHRRAMGFGVQSILRRIPMVLGPPLGGLLIAWLGLVSGMRLGLAVTIALTLFAAWLVASLYREQRVYQADNRSMAHLWRSMDGRLKRLLACDILSRWAEGIPRFFLVLYVLGSLGLSPLEFGWLITIQRTTSIVFYVPLAALSDRMNRKPFILATFAFFALFPLVLANAWSFWTAAVAFAVAGLWELGEPARKALIVDLAHEEARGRAIGIYYLLRNLAVFPAALVGGLLWTTAGPEALFYVAFVVGTVGFLLYALWGTGDSEPMPQDPPAPV